MQKEIPILFSTQMIQAILSGRKTMTRRTIKPFVAFIKDGVPFCIRGFAKMPFAPLVEVTTAEKCRYGKPGDILWVRESFCHMQTDTGFSIPGKYRYRTDKDVTDDDKWKPSIHMPKDACRIWLEVTGLKVERLHEISKEDAIAEGVANPNIFFSLWQKINGNWDDNPWVWCISFKVLSTTGRPSKLESQSKASTLQQHYS